MTFGINLYSLRHQIETPEAFLKTALLLKEMGYASLQFSGAPFDKEVIRTVSEQSEMPVVLTHVPLDRILDDTAALVAEHDYFGCRCVGLGMMKFRDLSDTEIRAHIATLEEAGKRLAQHGATFCYHHHSHEFCRMESGETIFDYLLNNTEHVTITLDTYWLQHGGVSVLEYIKRCEGRIRCAHLKDYLPLYKDGKNVSPSFAPVGEGNINWQDVIAALREAGVQHYLVEQDDATKHDDPFREVGSSIRYLNEHFAKEH